VSTKEHPVIRSIVMASVVALLMASAVACGGDGDADPTATGVSTSAASGTPVATVAVRPTPDVRRVVERAPGAPLDETSAAALLDAVLLKPADLTPGNWTVMTDVSSNNPDAAQADPANADANERCGRILGRTVVSQPEDVGTAFIGGETLAYFSMATAYESVEGASDCAIAQGSQLAEPGQLARAFGSLWIDPDAVTVTPVDLSPVGDGSFAATLTGQIEAAGTVIDLTVLLVAFQSGNVTGAVGSARSGSTPPADELAPLVDLVLARIEANR
jgi:hypothetical protein